MVACGAEYQSSWFSHSSFMYSGNWIDEYSCIHAKVLWQALELQDEDDPVHPEKRYPYARKTNKHNFHTELQILRFKRRRKEHSGGEASFVSILPAFWWRWYLCSYLKDGKKCKRRRGEARTETGGEQANVWGPTQSGWLDAELSGRVSW